MIPAPGSSAGRPVKHPDEAASPSGCLTGRPPLPVVLAPLEQRVLYSASPFGSGGSEEPAVADQANAIGAELLTDAIRPGPGHLILIDQMVDEVPRLVDSLARLNPQARIVILEDQWAGLDGLEALLGQYRDLERIDLFSHGDRGGLVLGNSRLGLDELPALDRIAEALNLAMASGADLFLYGCDLAGEAEGRAALERLGTLADIDLWASHDLTGAESAGGNWELEFSALSGKQRAVEASFLAVPDWDHLLSSPAVTATGGTSAETSARDRGSTRAVAMHGDGSFVAVWSADGLDGSGWGVFARRFTSDGLPVGPAFQVNQYTADDQLWASVGMDSAGNFVVTWTSLDQDGDLGGVYARLFWADGTARSGEFRVNSTTTGIQQNSSLAVADDGSFVVVWEGNGAGDSYGIFQRRYNAGGTALGAASLVNTATANNQYDTAISVNAAGQYAVSWDDVNGFHVQRFHADGTRNGAVLTASSSPTAGNGSVLLNDDESLVAVWRETIVGVRQTLLRVYDPANQTSPLPVLVNQLTTENQTNPSIHGPGNGEFIVVWEGSTPADDNGVYGRRFDADGTYASGVFLINSHTPGNQGMASLAVNSFAQYAVVWSGDGPDTSRGVWFQTASRPSSTGGILDADEDTPFTIQVAHFGYSDPEGDPLSAVQFVQIQEGTLLLSGVPVTPGQWVSAADISAGQLVYQPFEDENGLLPGAIEFRVSDGVGSPSDISLLGFSIAAVNDAPMLTGAGLLSLDPIDEDAIGNPGQTVLSVLLSSGSNPVTDPDDPAPLGIAIVAASPAGGAWQFSVDGGLSWQSLGAVAESSALLLRDSDRIRFQPDGVRGTSGSFGFRAWDQSGATAGHHGAYWNITETGGATAFSSNPGTASITVIDVNDEQSLAPPPQLTVLSGALTAPVTSAILSATDSDNAPSELDYVLTAEPTNGSLMLNGVALRAGDKFTQADVNAGLLTYQHDASETTSDSFSLTVDDGAGLVSTGSVTIVIEPVNDFAPVIISDGGGSTASVFVAENTSRVTQVRAIDADRPGQSLTYLIAGGADSGLFRIDGSTGLLEFATPPDRESPRDSDRNNVYEVRVAATDGELLATQFLVVSILDENEFSVTVPVDDDPALNQIVENATYGTTVGIVAFAIDGDATNSDVTWSLTDSAGGRFTIDPLKGVVSVAAGPRINREAVAGYWIEVVGASVDGSRAVSRFWIDVIDVNEYPVGPVSDQDPAANEVHAGAAAGTATGVTAAATDSDATDVVTWSLDVDAGGQFSIHGLTGVVTLARHLDAPAGTVFELIVRATSTDSSSSTMAVAIRVSSAGNGGPMVDVDPGSELPVADLEPGLPFPVAGPLPGQKQALSQPDLAPPVPSSAASSEVSVEPPESAATAASPPPPTVSPARRSDPGFSSIGPVALAGAGGNGPLEVPGQGSGPSGNGDGPVLAGSEPETVGPQVSSVRRGAGELPESPGEAAQRAPVRARLDEDLQRNWYSSYVEALAAQDDEELRIGLPAHAAASAATGILAVGYLTWMVKGSGALLSAVVSSLPAWQSFDPLVVIESRGRRDDDDDESIESMVDAESCHEWGAER